eukprot:2499494-Amphidinium_carterae.1
MQTSKRVDWFCAKLPGGFCTRASTCWASNHWTGSKWHRGICTRASTSWASKHWTGSEWISRMNASVSEHVQPADNPRS